LVTYLLSTQAYREDQLTETKRHLCVFESYNDEIDEVWREARWLPGLIALARRGVEGGALAAWAHCTR